jgi:hypothetical protein
MTKGSHVETVPENSNFALIVLNVDYTLLRL